MNISSVNLQSFAKNNQVFSGKQKPYYGFKDKEADIKTVSADDIRQLEQLLDKIPAEKVIELILQVNSGTTQSADSIRKISTAWIDSLTSEQKTELIAELFSSDRTDRSLPMYKLGDENIKIALAQIEKRLRQTPPMQTKYFISDPIDKNRLNTEDINNKLINKFRKDKK